MTTVLIPATGKYYPLALEQAIRLVKSCHYRPIILTDNTTSVPDSIRKVFIPHEPWPNITLKKFQFLLDFSDLLDSTHVLVHDADTRVKNLPPAGFFEHDLFSIEHPGFIGKTGRALTMVRNPKSTAYIPRDDLEQLYVMGAAFGGEKFQILSAAKTIDYNIKTDLLNGIMPLWHDESHWNAYCHKNKNHLIKFADYNRYFEISDKGGLSHSQIRAYP